MTMNAVLYYGPQQIKMERTRIPEINDHEVLVRIEVALTCGTDIKTFYRGHPLIIQEIPSPFGHEFCGIVEKVGSQVSHFSPGMRVVAANSVPCNGCYYCRIDRPSLCEHLEFLNGAYAEYIRIPERIVNQNLLQVPDNVTSTQAALCEPLACVIHGLEQTHLNMGDTVAIIGAGPIGLMFTRLAKFTGARVIVIGRNEFKLQKAKNMGADEVISIYHTPDPEKAVKALTLEGQGVDAVIEAVGLPEIWEKAINITRKGGVITFFGGCEDGTSINIDTKKLHYDERKIIGVFHHTPHYFSKALSLIERGQIDVDQLITHEFPLIELESAFDIIEARQALKVAIYP